MGYWDPTTASCAQARRRPAAPLYHHPSVPPPRLDNASPETLHAALDLHRPPMLMGVGSSTASSRRRASIPTLTLTLTLTLTPTPTPILTPTRILTLSLTPNPHILTPTLTLTPTPTLTLTLTSSQRPSGPNTPGTAPHKTSRPRIDEWAAVDGGACPFQAPEMRPIKLTGIVSCPPQTITRAAPLHPLHRRCIVCALHVAPPDGLAPPPTLRARR